jgi:hypothetical protein
MIIIFIIGYAILCLLPNSNTKYTQNMFIKSVKTCLWWIMEVLFPSFIMLILLSEKPVILLIGSIIFTMYHLVERYSSTTESGIRSA